MAAARLHPAENDRLDSLHSYRILDTEPEACFDRLVALAAHVCGTPIAAVSLIDSDRGWIKASLGIGALTQLPRSSMACSDVVADAAQLVVADALQDSRYRNHALVTGSGIRSYAGVPLIGRDRLPLGALCVLDRRPRDFPAQSLELLSGLAEQVVMALETRRLDGAAGLWDTSVLAEARAPGRLRQALDDGELTPHYQPVVDIVTGRTNGLEALLRWSHPTLGVLAPAAFLPVLENCALVVPVGRAILNAATAEIATLRRQGLTLPGGVAVNVASGQLARPGLAADVFAALDRNGVSPQELSLEITERTALPNPFVTRSELTSLADAGVRIVLDDFGVGWSNYARLLDLPAAALKLDRSIAGAVLRDERAATIVASTIATADEFGISVVAEGVETQAMRRRLIELGCRWAQGWLFNAAVPADQLPQLLAMPLGIEQFSPLDRPPFSQCRRATYARQTG